MAKNFTFRREPAKDVEPICFTIEGIEFNYRPTVAVTDKAQQLATEIGELAKAVPVDMAKLVPKYVEIVECILGGGAVQLLADSLGRKLEPIDFVDLAHYLTGILEDATKGK